MRRALTTTSAALAATGAGLLAYGSLIERQAFVVRRFDVPVLPRGADPIRVLHLSDVHLRPGQHRKTAWLRSLARLEPDLVVDTGDNLAHLDSLPPLLDAYDALLDVPGVFVMGSNDYYSPELRNPARYLWTDSGGEPRREVDLPVEQMRTAFEARGWVDLDNAAGALRVRGLDLGFVGVDDPHLGLDDLDAAAAPPGADLSMGVAHAPYLRVLDHWTDAGVPLILAGHTHGGQLRIPGYGALVTNCDLDRARARGLSTHSTPSSGPSWLHVSAGCGTSPYAPVRLGCRPEATLLELRPLDSPRS